DGQDLVRMEKLLAHAHAGLLGAIARRDERDRARRTPGPPVEPLRALPSQGRPSGHRLTSAQDSGRLDDALLDAALDLCRHEEPAARRTPRGSARLAACRTGQAGGIDAYGPHQARP